MGALLIVGLIAGSFIGGAKVAKGDPAGAKLEISARVPAGPDNPRALRNTVFGPEGLTYHGKHV